MAKPARAEQTRRKLARVLRHIMPSHISDIPAAVAADKRRTELGFQPLGIAVKARDKRKPKGQARHEKRKARREAERTIT